MVLMVISLPVFSDEDQRFQRGYQSHFPGFALSLVSQMQGVEVQQGIARIGGAVGLRARFGEHHTVSAFAHAVGEVGYDEASFLSRWLPLEGAEARYVLALRRRPWVFRIGLGFQGANVSGIQSVEWRTLDPSDGWHRGTVDFSLSRVADPVVLDAALAGTVRFEATGPAGLRDLAVNGSLRAGVLLNADFLVYGQIDASCFVISATSEGFFRPAAAIGVRWAVTPRLTLGTDRTVDDGIGVTAEYEIVKVSE
jgi:hypothetical protein